MNHKKLVIATLVATLVAPTAAQANPRNTLQPANVYFGQVKAGTHPERVIRVANHTGSAQAIHRFLIAGSGGAKFTLVAHDGARTATCHVGTILVDGASCTIIVRVKTATPEYWQSVIMVTYGATATSAWAGQWNGAVYAHVV